MKKTEIKIPKGYKATMRQDGNMIVIEYEEVNMDRRCIANGVMKRTKEEAISCTERMLKAAKL